MIARASSLTAFDEYVVGSKVTKPDEFMSLLEKLIPIDFKGGLVRLPDEACAMVSSGVGALSFSPTDYTLRLHGGIVSAYLRREFAAPATSVVALVYTTEAYLAEQTDPEDAGLGQELRAAAYTGYSHVLAEVGVYTAIRSERSPERFVQALAYDKEFDFLTTPGGGVGGGVYRAKVDTSWIGQVAGLRETAIKVSDSHSAYCVVADHLPTSLECEWNECTSRMQEMTGLSGGLAECLSRIQSLLNEGEEARQQLQAIRDTVKAAPSPDETPSA